MIGKELLNINLNQNIKYKKRFLPYKALDIVTKIKLHQEIHERKNQYDYRKDKNNKRNFQQKFKYL